MPNDSKLLFFRSSMLLYGGSAILGLALACLFIFVNAPVYDLQVEGLASPLEPVAPGETIIKTFVLRNRNRYPVTVDSIQASCSCVSLDKDSLTIDAGTSSQLTATLEASDSPGNYDYKFVLLSEKSLSPVLSFVFRVIVSDVNRPDD